MFQLLQRSIDRALTDLGNEMLYRGCKYRVTREVHAPVNLIIVAADGSKTCEVDFVPSFKLELVVVGLGPQQLCILRIHLSHHTRR